MTDPTTKPEPSELVENDKGLVFSFLRHYLAEDSETVQAHLRLTAGLADLEAANTELGDQWEASTAMALRVLRVLAEVTTSGELASSGYLRKRCGLSAEEWHGSGELLASLICFASDKGFLKWHARDMVGATSDPKPEPSERAKRIAEAIYEDVGLRLSPVSQQEFVRQWAEFLSTAGLAALEAECANRGKYIEEYANPKIRDLEARLAAAEKQCRTITQLCDGTGVVEGIGEGLLSDRVATLVGMYVEAERERDEARGFAMALANKLPAPLRPFATDGGEGDG